MKKICFISIFAYPIFNPKCRTIFGGAEADLFRYANTFKNKYKVYFLVGDFNQNNHETYKKINIIKGFKSFKYLYTSLSKIINLFIFFYKLNQINADVYIQEAAGIETGITALYCKLFKKKFIYMTASSIDTDGGYHRLKPFEAIFYEWGLKHATHVICQTRSQQTNLTKNYLVKSLVMKNSYLLPHKIPIKNNFVLWVGSAKILKQPQLFLDLAKSLPSHYFTIILPQHDLLLWNKIRKQVRYITNLKFIEKVPYRKINKYFSKAKVFVNTSTYEGFPNTFVQAAMYGTPIVSLNVNPDNFLIKNKCGFCANGSFNKLIKYTSLLLTNNRFWLETSQNAYNYARENHDINKNIKKIIRYL
jgi:glycosyltransferase involved in cell wall biosynthesis